MTASGEAAPLIVTAHLDADGFAALDALRRRHFPKHLNKIPAHISLFHHLPGHEEAGVRATLLSRCREVDPFDLEPTEWRSLGRGVALAYESAELSRLHGALSRDWSGWLTAQDRQGFRSHVTIQNKVEPAAARALLGRLREGPESPFCRVEGLSLWRYLGGPWEPIATFPFGQ